MSVRWSVLAAITVLSLTAGCEDLDLAGFSTGLANVADGMLLADGASYYDQHYRRDLESECPGVWEYGMVSNQTYSRVQNRSSMSMSITTIWSTGLETTQYLQPGEVGEFEYQTPSVTPDNLRVACN